MNKPLLLIIVIFLCLLSLGFVAIFKDHQSWEQFKIEHVCQIVGQKRSQSTGLFSHTPRQTGWLCDDGITYWR